MTTFQKSLALWIGGGLTGAIVGAKIGMPAGSSHSVKGAIGGGVLGALLVGGIGDAYLEGRARALRSG